MSPPPSSSTGSTPVFIAFIGLTFYGLGAGYLESFVNYPLWHIIGETDRWVAYHEALGPRVVVVLAIPALALSLIANVLLFVRRPPAVPAWTVAATLSLLLVSTASTFAIQIPIQMALDVAYDRAALDHLIWSSLWLRDIPGGIRAADRRLYAAPGGFGLDALYGAWQQTLVWLDGRNRPCPTDDSATASGSLRAGPARGAPRAARRDR